MKPTENMPEDLAKGISKKKKSCGGENIGHDKQGIHTMMVEMRTKHVLVRRPESPLMSCACKAVAMRPTLLMSNDVINLRV